jgi:hypothetical protein
MWQNHRVSGRLPSFYASFHGSVITACATNAFCDKQVLVYVIEYAGHESPESVQLMLYDV